MIRLLIQLLFMNDQVIRLLLHGQYKSDEIVRVAFANLVGRGCPEVSNLTFWSAFTFKRTYNIAEKISSIAAVLGITILQ